MARLPSSEQSGKVPMLQNGLNTMIGERIRTRIDWIPAIGVVDVMA